MRSRLNQILILVVLALIPARLSAEEIEPLPSLEFLEFLADWETENGDWLDPADLEKMDLPEREQENETVYK